MPREITKAQRDAVYRYEQKNYDHTRVRLPKGLKEELQQHAAQCGESLNGFINRAILETLTRDNARKTE